MVIVVERWTKHIAKVVRWPILEFTYLSSFAWIRWLENIIPIRYCFWIYQIISRVSHSHIHRIQFENLANILTPYDMIVCPKDLCLAYGDIFAVLTLVSSYFGWQNKNNVYIYKTNSKRNVDLTHLSRTDEKHRKTTAVPFSIRTKKMNSQVFGDIFGEAREIQIKKTFQELRVGLRLNRPNSLEHFSTKANQILCCPNTHVSMSAHVRVLYILYSDWVDKFCGIQDDTHFLRAHMSYYHW